MKLTLGYHTKGRWEKRGRKARDSPKDCLHSPAENIPKPFCLEDKKTRIDDYFCNAHYVYSEADIKQAIKLLKEKVNSEAYDDVIFWIDKVFGKTLTQ
jgi:hypothetical protein